MWSTSPMPRVACRVRVRERAPASLMGRGCVLGPGGTCRREPVGPWGALVRVQPATTAAPAATPIDADASLSPSPSPASSLSLLLRLHPPPALVPFSRRYQLLQLVRVVHHRDDQRARRTVANPLARAKLLRG